MGDGVSRNSNRNTCSRYLWHTQTEKGVIDTQIGKRTIIATLTILSLALLPAFAYMYTTQKQMPTGIIIKTPTLQIGVYWDAQCTNLVTLIDFGTIPQPNSNRTINKILYIKNEGDPVDLVLYWNSTLNLVTTEITETWTQVYPSLRPLNGTTDFRAGVPYLTTEYTISIPEYVSVGTYNWTLTIWVVY